MNRQWRIRGGSAAAVAAALAILAALAAPGAARADSMAMQGGVRFELADLTGIFVGGTTTDADLERAFLPCRVAVTLDPLPGGNVDEIGLTVLYDPAELSFRAVHLADPSDPSDPYWPGTVAVDTSVAGRLLMVLEDPAGVAPPTALQTFAWLEFVPLCQQELTTDTLTVAPGLNATYVEIDQQYYAGPDDVEDGSIQVADYDGYVSAIDPDPRDGEVESITMQGVAGTAAQFTVPIWFDTNFNLYRTSFLVAYDTTKVEVIGCEPAPGCGDWSWVYGGPISQPGLVGVALERDYCDPGEGPHLLLNLTCEVRGSWAGEETVIELRQWLTRAMVGYRDGGHCDALSYPTPLTLDDGTVAIERYEAALATAVDGMITPADIAAGSKLFWATASLGHNFVAGGGPTVASGDEDAADSRIRVDYALGERFSLWDIYRPDPALPDPNEPLDAFWFEQNQSSVDKTIDHYLELFAVPRDGLANERGITAEPVPLVRFQLVMADIGEPATWADTRVPIAYDCSFADRPAGVADAPTGDIRAVCADSTLTFLDAPEIRYFAGELYCPAASSTLPANVVQTYYVRSSFALDDFLVKVQKSGPHGIAGYDPAPGVVVVAHGGDYVTFGPGPDWAPAVCDDRLAIGTITYSYGLNVAAEHEALEKDQAPGPIYCWKYTTISFGPESYLADAAGEQPFMFISAGTVGSRYRCDNQAYPAEPLLSDKDDGEPRLLASQPNPFNPSTTIAFVLPGEQHVRIAIYDLLGRRVRTLVDGVLGKGRHEAVWHGRDPAGRLVASGVYVAVMEAGDFRRTQRLVLMK